MTCPGSNVEGSTRTTAVGVRISIQFSPPVAAPRASTSVSGVIHSWPGAKYGSQFDSTPADTTATSTSSKRRNEIESDDGSLMTSLPVGLLRGADGRMRKLHFVGQLRRPALVEVTRKTVHHEAQVL